MAVPRTKKTKVNRDRYNLIIQASAISLAVVIRVLKTVNDCTDKEVAEFIEGYLALYDEIGDGRVSPKELIRDTDELIGVDTLELMKTVVKYGK